MEGHRPSLAEAMEEAVKETPLQRLRREVKFKDGDTRGIAQAFVESWDEDGNGTLTRQEFLQGLKRYGVLVNDMSEAEKKALWKEFDSSGDGAIDLHEFLFVLGEVYKFRMELINEAFDKLDQDRSGEISVFELGGRDDLLRYFDDTKNPDGLISRIEFASYCSAISSVCPSDDEFRLRMEELSDIEILPLPGWRYICTEDPDELADWANRLYPNPCFIMGGLRGETYHVWCRPSKRSFIKGSYQYEFACCDNGKAVAEMQLLTERGQAALIDVDGKGRGHFLRIRSRPKRGTRNWTGRLRTLDASNCQQIEDFLNEHQPQPHCITAAIRSKGQMGVFVDDIGASGYKYSCKESDAIPVELIAKDECLMLGFTDEGQCIYLDVPKPITHLPSKRRQDREAAAVAKEAARAEAREMVRNKEALEEVDLTGPFWEDERRLRQIFDLLDGDGSGYISHAEMQGLWSLLDKCGVEGDGLDTGITFGRSVMDKHGMLSDDRLSYDEFCLVMLKVAQW